MLQRVYAEEFVDSHISDKSCGWCGNKSLLYIGEIERSSIYWCTKCGAIHDLSANTFALPLKISDRLAEYKEKKEKFENF